jgi:hypothetical protein
MNEFLVCKLLGCLHTKVSRSVSTAARQEILNMISTLIAIVMVKICVIASITLEAGHERKCKRCVYG